MNKMIKIKPMRLWQSILYFLGPGLYAVFAQQVLQPYLTQTGISEENAYNTTHITVFVLLFLVTFSALRMDGWDFSWSSFKERLRLKRMDRVTWRWTSIFLVFYLVLGLLLNILAQFAFEALGFRPPDADIPLTNIPFLLIVYIANIFSEEFWWRGYILPRQEMEHGKSAWIVNGILWSLFHMAKWWSIPFMLLKQWMLPFITQRTKNTMPAILIHLISNGFGILLSIIPLLPT